MLRFCATSCCILLAIGCTGSASDRPSRDGAPEAAEQSHQTQKQLPFSLRLVRIESGTFTMGAPPGESDSKYDGADEFPHEVEITRDYEIGATEVTREQFDTFVNETGYVTTAERSENGIGWDEALRVMGRNRKYSWRTPGFDQTPSHPVTIVSWFDAQEFCRWLSKRENRTYRLPTEAEWEFACRAGMTNRYGYKGDRSDIVEYGNVLDATARVELTGASCTSGWVYESKSDRFTYTAPVGTFQPNLFGLYDMHGNVQEWCQDAYEKTFYLTATKQNPLNRGSAAAYRVLRGGNCLDAAGKARCASRGYANADFARFDIGFRVVREVQP